MPPFVDNAEWWAFVLANPMQGLCIGFAFIGTAGAIAYFPHIALGKGPRRRRLWAALATAMGLCWLIIAYVVARSAEPAVGFIYTQAFASIAPFGVITLVLERFFGHPWFQTEDDFGPRLLARMETQKRRQS